MLIIFNFYAEAECQINLLLNHYFIKLFNEKRFCLYVFFCLRKIVVVLPYYCNITIIVRVCFMYSS